MRKPSRTDMPKWAAGLVLLGLMAAAWGLEKASPKLRAARKSRQTAAAAKPRSPTRRSALARPTWRDWKAIARRVYEAVGETRLLAVAAGIVFYGLLAFFPAITALVSFYGLFTDPATIRDHLSLAEDIVPEGGFDIMREQVDRFIAKGGAQLSLAFIVSTLFAIWSANAGMKAMMDALNVIYKVPEQRGFIKLNAVSLTLTVGGMAMLLLAIGSVVVFPLVLSFVGLDSLGHSSAPQLRWPVLLFGVLLALAVLYRFGPSPRGARWRWITPGSAMATVLWIIGSASLSWYFSNFAHYDATYGSLGAAIGLMMWMWMSSIVILFGAQLNNTLDTWHETWHDQPEKPMRQTPMQGRKAQRAATA